MAGKAGQVAAGGVPSIAQRGLAISRYTHLCNALLVAWLFWLGAISFKKVPFCSQLHTDSTQLPSELYHNSLSVGAHCQG